MDATFRTVLVLFALAALSGTVESASQETSSEALANSDYEIRWQMAGNAEDADEGWQAINRAHGLRSQFEQTSVRILPLSQPSWNLVLSLAGYGRGSDVRLLGPAALEPDGNRIGYRRDGMTEWYDNGPRGIEQGFVLQTSPEYLPSGGARRAAPGGRAQADGTNTSPAFLVLDLRGDLVPILSPDGQAIDFAKRTGGFGVVRYSELKVTDATATELHSWMELFDDGRVQGIRLLFDDSDAVYPVTVDPLVTQASWGAEGDLQQAHFAWSVSGAGDVNGDGFDDVVVGAPDAPVDIDDDEVLECGAATDNSECSVGAVYVYHGSLTGLSTAPDSIVEGDQPGARFGYSVSGAGNVNGDGFADVIVGAPDYDGSIGSNEGRTYVFTGSPSGVMLTPAWMADGEQADSHFGWSVAGAGDITGDGNDDWIVGAPDFDGPSGIDEGRAYAYLGSDSAFDSAPAWTADGDQAGARFGFSVAGAGNVNGTGFDDVIVGSPYYDDPAADPEIDHGRVRVYLGLSSTSGLASLAVWSAIGETDGAHFGWSVASAGDSDNDGNGDWIVGAPEDGVNDEGRAYIYLGSNPVPPTSLPAWDSAGGDAGNARFGGSVSGAGDVNQDGTHDVLIGATGWRNPGEYQGRARLYYGPADPLRNWAWETEGLQINEQLGYSVACAGDVNRDGIPDVIIGSPFFHRGQSEEGRAQVFHGARGVNATNLAERLGIPIVDGSPSWEVQSPRGFSEDQQSTADAVWFGPSPGSVLMTTGRVVDGGLGDTDWGLTAGAGTPADGLPDVALFEFSALVPAGKTTLCFATQFITSEVPQDTDTARFCVNRDGGSCNPDQDLTELAFQEKNPPMQHCIDVAGKTAVFLQFEVADGDSDGDGTPDGDQDSGLLLSRFYFSGLPMPSDVLSETVDGYFSNPAPFDVSRIAGTFTASQDLFAVPGMSMPFFFKISYNSASTHEGSTGKKWMHSYDTLARKFGDGNDIGDYPDNVLVRVGDVTTYFVESNACAVSGSPCADNSECPPGEACVPASGVYRSKFGGNFGAIALSNDTDRTVSYTSKARVTYDFLQKKGVCVYGTAEGENCDQDADCPGSGFCILPELLLTKITDINGHEMVLEYDADDRLERITDTRGECFSFVSDAQDRLQSVTPGCPPAPDQPQVSFAYDSTGLLRTVTDLGGRVTSYTYFDDGTLASSTDGDGALILSNTYESFVGLGLDQGGDRLVIQRDGREGDLGRSFAYDEESVINSDQLGRSSTRAFDVKSRVAVETDPTGVRLEFFYDRNNRRIETRRQLPSEPANRLTEHNVYDRRGNVLAQTAFPETCVGGTDQGNSCLDDDDCRDSTCGLRVHSTYDLRDNVRSTSDPAGNTWTFDYDPGNNLTRENDPLGNVAVHSYGLDGTGQKVIPRPVSTMDARGNTSTCDYDPTAGYLTSATGPLGNTLRHTYDDLGRRTSTSDPIGVANPGSEHTACVEYDAVGLVVAHSFLCTDDCQSCQLRSELTYDERGRVLTRTGPDGAVFRASYTPTDQVAERVDPLGNTARFAYDVADRLVSRTAPSPADRPGSLSPVPQQFKEFAYDDGDRLTNVRAYDRSGGTLLAEVRATYDEAGNPSCVIDPNGNVFRMEYDLLGRLTSSGPAASCQSTTTSPIRSAYNALGLIDSVTNARNDTISYAYDAGGRLAETTFDETSITHIVDAHGNRVWSDRNGKSIVRAFDPLDRLTSRTGEFGNTVGYTYDSAGNLVELRYPSGVSVAYEYDGKNRLTQVTDWHGKSTFYDYNAGGNISMITLPDGSVVTWTHDLARRLTGISDSVAGFEASYTLNSAGLTVTADVTLPLDPEPSIQYPQADETFEYGSRNGMTSRGSFDADGNMTAATIDGTSTTLTYNAVNQLVSLEQGGSDIDLFRYDADGLRVEVDRNGAKRRYVYDVTAPTTRVLEERDDDNNLVARYVYGLGLVSREGPGGLPSYRVYHYDKRGSTVALTDQTGTITDRYAYDPFGKLAERTGTTDNRFRYNGRDGVVDDDNGLYYMRARYYAPELMRFVQQDLVFKGTPTDPQSLNRYAFVQGNPIDLTDPNGDLIFTTILVAVECLPGATITFSEDFYEQSELSCTFPQFAGAAVQGAILDSALIVGLALGISGAGLPAAIAYGAFAGALAGAAGAVVEESLETQGEDNNFGPFQDVTEEEEGFSVREVVLRTTKGAVTGAIGGVGGVAVKGVGGLATKSGIAIKAFGIGVSVAAGFGITSGFNAIWEDPEAGPQPVDPTTPFGPGNAAPPRIRPSAPPGAVDPTGAAADRLNPLAVPVPGPQRTTSCGCACEVWR